MAIQAVAIRADASSKIGTGHFMRCFALAEFLKQQDIRVCFVSRELPKHLMSMLKSRNFEIASLDNTDNSSTTDNLDHSHWLGASQEYDAQATIELLSDTNWDWLIIDHYAIDFHWESLLRDSVDKIFVIDDIADRKHDCDILLDQNFYSNMESRYIGKVPEHCRLMLGPNYALLREEFRKLRKQTNPRRGPIKRILVFFGGVDFHNFTGLTIQILSNIDSYDIHVDVVIGEQHPCSNEILTACLQHGFHCHVQTNRMAKLMASSDLSIGAGGSASWERCCLGLPALIASVADNQIDIALSLEKIGASIYLGSRKQATKIRIQNCIMDLLNDRQKLEVLSKEAYALVDGRGVHRACLALGC
ncbi:UDP-2,4-diacetamido-2,4,6-trideoxy-beta-L-altropyranose hydrolase [Thermodesulfobacteriota bacterium]